MISKNPDLLISLTEDELTALADSKLAPSSQARMDQLLQLNAEDQLDESETRELDQFLAKVDQLTILKARAMFTLQHHSDATEF